MKQIEKEMIQAIRAKRSFNSGNTSVKMLDGGDYYVYLHGNCIYMVCGGISYFTLSGWNTVTTRSRLNALGVNVCQRNFMPYVDGKQINESIWYAI